MDLITAQESQHNICATQDSWAQNIQKAGVYFVYSLKGSSGLILTAVVLHFQNQLPMTGSNAALLGATTAQFESR